MTARVASGPAADGGEVAGRGWLSQGVNGGRKGEEKGKWIIEQRSNESNAVTSCHSFPTRARGQCVASPLRFALKSLCNPLRFLVVPPKKISCSSKDIMVYRPSLHVSDLRSTVVKNFATTFKDVFITVCWYRLMRDKGKKKTIFQKYSLRYRLLSSKSVDKIVKQSRMQQQKSKRENYQTIMGKKTHHVIVSHSQ